MKIKYVNCDSDKKEAEKTNDVKSDNIIKISEVKKKYINSLNFNKNTEKHEIKKQKEREQLIKEFNTFRKISNMKVSELFEIIIMIKKYMEDY